MKVRADHTARAIENSVYFMRGNNVVLDPVKSGITRNEGIGYGDSYVIDPGGEILVRSRRQVEDFITAEIDPTASKVESWGLSKSAWSYREFHSFVEEAMSER
jgi:predicted amidohydrolase